MTRRNLRSSNNKFEYISLKTSIKDGDLKDGPSKYDPTKDLFEFDNYLITHTPETLSISIVDQIDGDDNDDDNSNYKKHDINTSESSSNFKILSKPLNLRKYNSSTRSIRSKNVKSSDLKIIKNNINKLTTSSSSTMTNINYINQFHKKCEINEKKMFNLDKEKLKVEIDTYLTNLINLIKEYDNNNNNINYNNINYSNYSNYNNNLLNKIIFKNFKYPYSNSYPFNKINNRGIINNNNYKLDNIHHDHHHHHHNSGINGFFTNGNSIYDTENNYNNYHYDEIISENEIIKLINNFKINKNLINKLNKLTKLNNINDLIEIKMKLKLTIKELKNYINTFNYLKNKEIYLKKELKEFDINHNHNHNYHDDFDTDSDNDSDNDIINYIKLKESGIKNPINLKILKKKRNLKKFKKYGPLIKINFYNGLSLLIDPILPPKIEFK
ncbi:unnamed protein product [[Candida] boidinii]|uniref:Unnamed protein product n=1 Tax=Candida boidinii TaxID=5477 RepID=A0ACB5TWS4_CANBO|nr:unnamed protein product [[Candida] boidinii]